MKLYFCTGNQGKLKELSKTFEGCGIEIQNIDIEIPEWQGTSHEIARKKCTWAYDSISATAPEGGDIHLIVEDTSLGFNAMNGLPGPYIKWFVQELGPPGLHKMLHGFEDKTAVATCTFAYWNGVGKGPLLFEGKTAGTIVEPRGGNNFCWDPVFQPEGSTKTYAEMDREEKGSISHRGKAGILLREFLVSQKQTPK
eukprot:GHVO01011814.1.p1 GENE.GHVO01011814.1~~GHVO01011814.1.p1  ORF type:complete len:197 (-),score=30.75 GHVO01011814.1:383-973(-)